jgi:hypothetical protein
MGRLVFLCWFKFDSVMGWFFLLFGIDVGLAAYFLV